MAMGCSVARQAMPLPRARSAMPLSTAPHAIRPSATRPITSAHERPVRMQSNTNGQPEPAVPDLAMILGTAAVVVTIIGGLQSIVINNISSLKSELAASIREQAASISENKSEQAASSRELAASIREQAASNSVLNTKLDSISKDVASNNSKLDTLNANLQAQQVKTAELQGQVTILRDGGKKK